MEMGFPEGMTSPAALWMNTAGCRMTASTAGLAEQEAAEPQTYETVQDYIDSLNQDTRWVSYDSASHTASITSVEDFVKACKKASKNIGAFDDLEGTQGENVLFGYGDGAGTHFDPIMAELFKGQ